MKLAILSSSTTGGKAVAPTFKDFRALARLQPPHAADRLARLARGVEKSIRSGDSDRYRRARWLEEAVSQIACARPKHPESQELQLCLTRLLRNSFQSMDWRRPLIRKLNPASVKAQGLRLKRGI
ncbi:hypothetical protein [uncultured Rhodoblastus sp.]|uniref:hypothetical protein n=1 Tax=uncultured Rhodoblastus sp. TaxID=543037 RepID=UPI0025DBFC64|nr:hypothetical protein [uncultured Rhodoblastus sp.]